MSRSELSFLLVVFVLPLLIGAAVMLFTWGTTREPRVRRAVAGAVAGSILLVIASAFLGLCGLGENRSELFNERCSGGTPNLPLLGIPILLWSLLPIAIGGFALLSAVLWNVLYPLILTAA